MWGGTSAARRTELKGVAWFVYCSDVAREDEMHISCVYAPFVRTRNRYASLVSLRICKLGHNIKYMEAPELVNSKVPGRTCKHEPRTSSPHQ